VIFDAKKISLIFWEISKSFHLKRKNSKSQRAITPSTMVWSINRLRAKVQEQEQSIRTVLGSGSAGGTDIIQKCHNLSHFSSLVLHVELVFHLFSSEYFLQLSHNWISYGLKLIRTCSTLVLHTQILHHLLYKYVQLLVIQSIDMTKLRKKLLFLTTNILSCHDSRYSMKMNPHK
jgi:hypothetical protein